MFWYDQNKIALEKVVHIFYEINSSSQDKLYI